MIMNINIQTVHFNADVKLIDYISKKLEKLSNYSDRIIEVNVFLKLDNIMHVIKDKIAEIRVHVPKHNFFVKSTSKSFEDSFDEALDSMISQIKKNKDRKVA
jgi:putative sigma-54 modulation protein